jgi:single-stranded DNA-specific DHH superfamily exonuclease
MLTEKEISKIKEHLDKAQNPLFFFDNDNDGLASFLILQRFIRRGKGIAIKSFPDLNASYYRRVKELNPDYVFILDRPLVSQEFLDKVKADNIPIVWIDHHQVDKPKDKDIDYYNPYHTNKTSEPVSYISYKVTNKKEDVWLAVIGCISDCFLPEFYAEFLERFPDLGTTDPKSPFELFYKTEIGEIARILDFSLKDTTTNVVNMQKFMMKAKGPRDILEENHKTKQILKRYQEINTKYQELMERARKFSQNKFLYFQYGGNLSLSSNLANQLSYEFPDKTIVVVYIRGDNANISIRGKDARKITLEAIKSIPEATGGGHEEATGAKMPVSDLPKFKETVEKLI